MRNRRRGECGLKLTKEKSFMVVLWIPPCRKTCSISYARVSRPSTTALPTGPTTTSGISVFPTRRMYIIHPTSTATSTAPHAMGFRWMNFIATRPVSLSGNCRFYPTSIHRPLRCSSTWKTTMEAERSASRKAARRANSTIRLLENADRFTAQEMDRSSAMAAALRRLQMKRRRWLPQQRTARWRLRRRRPLLQSAHRVKRRNCHPPRFRQRDLVLKTIALSSQKIQLILSRMITLLFSLLIRNPM